MWIHVGTQKISGFLLLKNSEEYKILGWEKVDKEEGGKDAIRDGLGVDD